MKKSVLFTLCAGLLCFMAVSCNQPNDTGNGNSDTLEDSKLSAGQGKNEVAGGNYSNSTNRFSFNNCTVTKQKKNETSSSSSASLIARSASEWNDEYSFYYTYNSNDNYLEFQVKEILTDTTFGTLYSEQLASIKQQYTKAGKTVVETLGNSSLYASIPDTSIQNKVMNQVVATAQNLLDAEEDILEQYLEDKYSSIIRINYGLDEDGLTLKQAFLGDLTDASSNFKGSSIELNNYTRYIPFGVYSDVDLKYIGVPVIYQDNKTLTVDVYPFLLVSNTNEVTSFINNMESKLQEALTNTDKAALIYLELTSNKLSTTLQEFLDEVAGSLELSGTYDLSDDNVLTLTFAENDVGLSTDALTLSFVPLINGTYAEESAE